jgi:hypothetical protein
MNEDQAREALEQILKDKYDRDLLYSETKMSNGDGFVETYIKKIKRLSDGEWNQVIAKAQVETARSAMFIDMKRVG